MNTETPPNDTQPLSIDTVQTSRPDEEIAIKITGSEPGASVTFEAAMADASGVMWRFEATFTADEDGVVDLSTQAPESGAYDGVRPMGWLWSMEADDEDQLVTELMHAETTTVTVRASTGSETAERQIERGFDDESIVRETVATDEFVGTIFEPASGEPPRGQAPRLPVD